MKIALVQKKVTVPSIKKSKSKPKPDQRAQIPGSATIEKPKESFWARCVLTRRMILRQKRRRLQKENEDILRSALDDATFASSIGVPQTLEEALPEDAEKRAKDERAMVVTEASGSFNMIGCNKAWENLCGFAECEIIGKDSSILQGPDTNIAGLSEAVSRLFEGEKKVNVVTTNYRKDGSKFTNFLTLAPLKDASGKLTHFVAILNDISGGVGKKKAAATLPSSPGTVVAGTF